MQTAVFVGITPLDAATLLIACLGFGLGLLAEWRERSRDQVKLTVVPKIGIPTAGHPNSKPLLVIHVINNSRFPVTITEFGWIERRQGRRALLTQPRFIDGGVMPRRLEPFDVCTAFGDALDPQRLMQFSVAYAEIVTGERFAATSDALQYYRKHGTVPPVDHPMLQSQTPGYLYLSKSNGDW